jgi:4-amino-4-deoxy-L-arabinose transferase-like glycosyltransferase
VTLTRSLLLAGALILALLAQGRLDAGATETGLALGLLAAAGSGWLSRGLCRAPALHTDLEPRSWRPAWLLAGSLLALASSPLLGPSELTQAGTTLWLLGLGLALVGLWDGPPPWARSGRQLANAWRGGPVAMPWAWLALASIVLLAACYRLYELADLPGEQGPDIPLKIDIVAGMLGGQRPIFSTIFPGRETLFFYLVAIYAAFFGNDQFALKLVSVLCSLLTIPLAYRLAARWFGAATGLWAAAFLALAPWHIIISRIGYRGVLVPLFVALTLLLLDRALYRGARRDFAVLGLVVGLGFYTYTAYQAVPLALALIWAGRAALLVAESGGQPWPERLWAAAQPRWLWAALVAALTLIPLARFAGADWQSFFLRAGSRVTGVEAPLPADLGAALATNMRNSLGMFNVRGDVAFILNVPNKRTLGFVSGALFLLGLGVMAARIRRRPFALIAVFLVVMQLPSALALAFPNEVPAALRASGALVPAYLLVALPLPLLFAAVRAGWRGRLVLGLRADKPPLRLPLRAVGLAAMGLVAGALVLGEARESWRTYFTEYRLAQPFENYPLTRMVARAADDYAGEGPVVLKIWPYWTDGNAIRAQLERLPLEQYSEAYPEQFTPALLASLGPRALFILHPDDDEGLALLRASYPRGALVTRRDFRGQPAFQTFYGEH